MSPSSRSSCTAARIHRAVVRGDEEHGWVRIQATGKWPGDDEDEKWHHTHSLINVHESAVFRVQVCSRKERSGGPIGFSFGTADEAPARQPVVSQGDGG